MYSKMKGKTLREKITKSVQRTTCFCFIHEKFLKSLGCISSQLSMKIAYFKSLGALRGIQPVSQWTNQSQQ